MAQRAVILLGVVAIATSGCSTRPREFRAVLAVPPPEAAAFDHDMLRCQVLVRRGVKKDFAGSAAQLVVGSGGGVAAGAIAGSTAQTLGSALSAGTGTLFVVGPLVGFGVSRIIRSGREKKYKQLLGNCMGEYGYSIASWSKQRKLSKAEIAKFVDATAAGTTASPPIKIAP